MAVKFNLKWRNKFSGETGYVKTVSPKSKCFFNTFNKEDAKKYTSEAMLNKDLAFLESIGEMYNNIFFTEAAI